MTAYVAMVRAVNVGGTGRLPMPVLAGVCRDAGFASVATFLASGNVVFCTEMEAEAVRRVLGRALAEAMGREIGVLVRSAAEMAEVLRLNPFPEAPGDRVVVLFLEEEPPAELEALVRGRVDEEVRPGVREIFAHYPQGQARTRLKLPGSATGTARNRNTVEHLLAMLRERA